MDESQLKNKILSELRQVNDPELNRDIVSLGMVKAVRFRDDEITIELELTSPTESLKRTLSTEVEKRLGSLPLNRPVKIEFQKTVKAASFSQKSSIPGVGQVIAVASGKGGVGKSTVAVNLALALRGQGCKVGLMDGDIYGPNIPLMLGIPHDRRPRVTDDDKMEPIEAYGIKAISMGVLVPPDQPMVWRGPMLHSAVTQFLQKVDWGELDFLLVDLPPGTGDVQLSLVQSVPLAGAVIVTTPQEVALMDVRKGIAMFHKTQVPILGIIENMSGEIFGRGGGRKAAEQFQVPFLGEIPLDQKIREGGDAGQPIVVLEPESKAGEAFIEAARLLIPAMKKGNSL